MAKVRKLRKRDWERKIWETLIDYANSGSEQDFRTLAVAAMDWIAGDSDDLKRCGDVTTGESLEVLASRYLSDVRRLMAWLSDPKANRDSASQAVEFLRKHGTAISIHITSNTGSDENLLLEWPDEIGFAVSPVCRFVWDQIERHDIHGEPLRDVIPFKMCDRPECGKFRLIKTARKGRFFCSNLCKATFHQERKTKKSKAAYMREYRSTIDRHKPVKGSK